MKIYYRLPQTELVVTGSVVTTTDELTGDDGRKQSSSLKASAAKLVTSADPDTELTVDVPTGLLWNFKGSFEVADDGRLTSASSETTGQLGTALKSVATLAGTVAAAAALGPAEDAEDPTAARAEEEGRLERYGEEFQEEHEALVEARETRKALAEKLRIELSQEVQEENPDPREGKRLSSLMRLVEQQLEPLEAHFKAWQATKVTTSERSFEFRVALNEIPTSLRAMKWEAGASVPPTEDPPTGLKELWEQHGVGIEANWVRGARNEKPSPTETKDREIVARVPDLLQLKFYEAQPAKDGEKPVIVEKGRQRALVADDFSVTRKYKLKRSLFGKKSLDLEFNSDGFLKTVGVGEDSAVAGGLESLAGVAGGFAGGVETGTKAYNAVKTAGQASLDAELARVKAEVELQQNQLLKDGLDATSDQAVRLKRLQQLKDVLEAQTSIAEADPKLVADLAAQTGGGLDWYSPPAPAGPPEPQVIQLVITRDGDDGSAPKLDSDES